MAALARSVLVSERFEVAMERVWPDKDVWLFAVSMVAVAVQVESSR